MPWEIDDKYLITLCEECHEIEEERKEIDWYELVVHSGITRTQLYRLLGSVSEYFSYVDPRDIESFNDLIAKFNANGTIREQVKSEFHAEKTD